MPLDRERFEVLAFEVLKKEVEQSGLVISDDLLVNVVHALSNIFQRYAIKVSENPELHLVVDGIVRWTPERDKEIAQLSQEMSAAFEPIINPDEPIYEGLFWSGPAKKRALAKAEKGEGSALESTLWGRFLEGITPDMNDCFFPGAYTPHHDAQTASSLLIWDATSRTFAQKMQGDVEVTLLDADTRSQSVFFNTELPRLRALQAAGTVKDIYLSSFTELAMDHYQALLNTKTGTKQALQSLMDSEAVNEVDKSKLEHELERLEKGIMDLIKDQANWERVKLDKKASLKLITGGKTSGKGHVRFSKMIGLGDKWRGKIRSLGEAIDPLLDRIRYFQARKEQGNSLKILGRGQYLLRGYGIHLLTKPSHPNQPSVKSKGTLFGKHPFQPEDEPVSGPCMTAGGGPPTEVERDEGEGDATAYDVQHPRRAEKRYAYFKHHDDEGPQKKGGDLKSDNLEVRGKSLKR